MAGFPEMLDGRVKTLHPGILQGILAKRDKSHMDAIEHGIGDRRRGCELVPVREAVAKRAGACVENIDIGVRR